VLWRLSADRIVALIVEQQPANRASVRDPESSSPYAEAAPSSSALHPVLPHHLSITRVARLFFETAGTTGPSASSSPALPPRPNTKSRPKTLTAEAPAQKVTYLQRLTLSYSRPSRPSKCGKRRNGGLFQPETLMTASSKVPLRGIGIQGKNTHPSHARLASVVSASNVGRSR
jgi:hypothetical protein